MSRVNTYLIPALAVLISSIALTAPAAAGDIQGDAYNCKELWVMRNQIYKNGGYCFKTAKAIRTFGNAGCGYDSLTLVPVSDQDRLVIRDIKRSENRLRC